MADGPAELVFCVKRLNQDQHVRVRSTSGKPDDVLQAYLGRVQQQAPAGHRLSLEERCSMLDDWVECSPDKPIANQAKLRVVMVREGPEQEQPFCCSPLGGCDLHSQHVADTDWGCIAAYNCT
jgi:hypothetical protein